MLFNRRKQQWKHIILREKNIGRAEDAIANSSETRKEIYSARLNDKTRRKRPKLNFLQKKALIKWGFFKWRSL